jgi:hypothetical protein
MPNRESARPFLPNAFILGAAKCGTTYLHTHLSHLPEVCMSKPKEPLFFPCNHSKGLEFYKKTYFRHWMGEKIIGESNHRNLYLPYIPELIYRCNPDAKLIVMIRNPIERAFSHWKHAYYYKQDGLDFDKALRADLDRIRKGLHISSADEIRSNCDKINTNWLGIYRTYIDSGYYFLQIKRYLEYFDKQQLKVILLEELHEYPRETFNSILEFLGLKHHLDLVTLKEKANEAGVILPLNPLTGISKSKLNKYIPVKLKSWIKKCMSQLHLVPEIKPETRQWLQKHYESHNRELSQFLEKDLSCWK